MNFINFNGQLLPANQAIFSANTRLAKYGDGLFESIRMFKGQLPFLDLHFQRLLKGMKVLKFPIPAHYSIVFFENEIQKLLGKKANARIRLTVFRRGVGLYLPREVESQFLIEVSPLETTTFTWNTAGLHIDLYNEIPLAVNSLSTLKTCNSLPYIMAALYRQENELEECLLLNAMGNIAEASSSNLFVFYDGEWLTTDDQQGAIEGTTQQLVIETAKTCAVSVRQTTISQNCLENASEVFLCNAIQGIRWVKSFRTHQYQCIETQKIFSALVQKTMENPKNSV